MRWAKKSAMVFVLIFCVLCAASCTKIVPYSTLNGYLQLLESLPRYDEMVIEPIPSPEPTLYQAPSIAGFAPLLQVPFDKAQDFSGTYAQVTYDGEDYLIDQSGTLYYQPDYLDGYRLQYDRFVFVEQHKQGIKSVYGTQIAPALYEAVVMRGALSLAQKSNGATDIYRDNQLVQSDVQGEVSIYDEGVLLYNGRLCDEMLTPLTVGEYAVTGSVVNGARLIYGDGMVGFDLGDTLITPQFLFAGQFNPYGYAYVVDTVGEFYIIDTSGNKVQSAKDNRKPVGYDGQVTVYWNDEAYLLLDGDIEFYDLLFLYPQNGYLVERTIDGAYRFFSIADGAFLSQQYQSVRVVNGYYIVEMTDESYQLLDQNLQVIVESAQSIVLNASTLLVQSDNKYHYYTEELVV